MQPSLISDYLPDMEPQCQLRTNLPAKSFYASGTVSATKSPGTRQSADLYKVSVGMKTTESRPGCIPGETQGRPLL